MDTNQNSTMAHQVYKSRQIIIDIMRSQGYDVSKYEGFGINEVTVLMDMDMQMIFHKITKDSDSTPPHKVCVMYDSGQQRAAAIARIVENLYDVQKILNDNDTLMIVSNDDANDTTTSYLQYIWEQNKRLVIVLGIRRTLFNLLKHAMVHPHRILSAEEAILIKKKFNITDDSKLPSCSRFDAVSQIIMLKPGELVEIIRPSKTAVSSLYYKICTNMDDM